MAASDIYQQGTKLFYSPSPGAYTPISDPAQLQILAKQGAVKVGTPYLPLPINTPPVAPSPSPGPSGGSTSSSAVPAPVGGGSTLATPTAPVQGSQMAFQQAFGKLMENATKNQALQDQMMALIRSRYDGVTAVADPSLPPAVQEAIRNRDTAALDFQIASMRQQLQGRSTDQTNALQYLVSGYQSDVQAAQQRQQQADAAIRDMLKTYGSTLSQVGVTQEELQQYENTGVMPPALGTKLMQAATIAQTKATIAENKPFIIGQTTDASGNKINVYGVNVQDPKTGTWSVKQVSGPDVPNGNAPTGGVNVGGYDISSYATDPQHEQKVQNILNSMGQLTSVSQMDQYIQQHAKGSPVTGQMIADASQKYGVTWEMIMAMMQQDSSLGTAGLGAKTHNPGNVGNNDSGSTKDFGTWQAGVDAVAEWLSKHPASSETSGGVPGTTGQPTIDTSIQGYASKPVPGAGGLTQAAIDQAALQYVTTGTMPSIGLGSSGPGGQRKTAIQNRAGELSSGGNIASNKANLKALTTSLSKQTDYANTVERSVSNAEHGFQQLLSAFQDSGINTSDSALLNKSMNEVAKKITGGKIFAFNAGLAEVGNEYANVFSRGGQVTEGVRNRANEITNGNVSMKDLMEVQKELQAQGGIVVQGAKDQVKSIQDQINGIVGGSSTNTTDSSKDPMGIR